MEAARMKAARMKAASMEAPCDSTTTTKYCDNWDASIVVLLSKAKETLRNQRLDRARWNAGFLDNH
jgi:hypothetical protein